MPTLGCEPGRAAATADEALGHLPRDVDVFVAGYVGTPYELAAALVRIAPSRAPVRVLTAVMETTSPLAAWPGRSAGHIALLFPGPALREGLRDGWAQYLPLGFFDVSRMLAAGGLAVDVACIQATPPDDQGRCHLGPSVDIVPEAVRCARTVIAELNPALPRARGRAWIPAHAIDYSVKVNRPPLAMPSPAPASDVERAVAERVVDLVPENATLQLGLGGIMNAVAQALRGRRGLGIHSGLFTDGLMDLVREGSVDNQHKGRDRGRSVATMAAGTRQLHRFIDDNPQIALEPVSHTHAPATLAGIQRLAAINSAFEVDLTGAVNAEAVGGRPAAGVGGQLDFARGAHLSPEGRFILALPSTGGRDRRSRIVARFALGTPVTTPRSDVGWVVTEYGAANLRGLTLAERAEALIAIAHPDHRRALCVAVDECRPPAQAASSKD